MMNLKKLFLFFYFSFLAFTASTLAEDSNDTVYIVTGTYARTYHKTPQCLILKHCEGHIMAVTSAEAKKRGRKICQVCIHKLVVSTRKNKDSTVYVGKNNTKLYHEYLDCNDLNSEDGYTGILFDEAEEKNLSLCKRCEEAALVLRGGTDHRDNHAMYLVSFAFILLLLILFIYYNHINKKKKQIDISDFKPEVADTRIISLFLQQFAKRDALKYTTHSWDLSMETGKKMFQDYDDFRNQYCEVLSQWKQKVSPLCPLLWQLVNNFMIDEEGGHEWSRHNIRIGYNKYVREWMIKHPDEQPQNMPLSEFPDKIRPKTIGKKSVVSFLDVVNVFKKCIQFRDDSLYSSIKSILKEKNVSYSAENLKCLKTLTIFTDTEIVKDVFGIIAGNISQHGETSEIEMSCNNGDKDGVEYVEIGILHIGSFSNKDIFDKKITGEDVDGAIASIKNRLRYLADFAVESMFSVKGKATPLHINYLVSNPSEKGMYTISEEQCRGFKYILTFYTYNQ